MISNAEIEHVRKLKKWSEEGRKQIEAQKDTAIGKLIQKMTEASGASVFGIYDNLDYLVTILEREYKTQRVKHLTNLGDQR